MNRNLGAGAYRYGYQGQEWDQETGWEAFELRMWDGRLGRWMSIDPAGQYPSPYVGMGNNPVGMVDPDGAKAGPPTIYENQAGDQVEVHDGVDKTILVNDPDFETARFFANEVNSRYMEGTTSEGEKVSGYLGVTQEVADAYLEFYNQVNYYDGVNLANLWDYFYNKPSLHVFGKPLTGTLPIGPVAGRGGLFKSVFKRFRTRSPLPALDATRKVHGVLPRVKDLGKYSKEELRILVKELKQSVQQRIKVTSKMGRDRGHGQRQGAEQDLIKSIEKHLENFK